MVESLEALDVSALQLDEALQVGKGTREIGPRPGLHPGVLRERGRAGDLRAQLAGHPAGAAPFTGSDPDGARLDRVVIEPLGPWAKLVEKPAQLIGGEPLVADPHQGPELLGASLGPARRHAG